MATASGKLPTATLDVWLVAPSMMATLPPRVVAGKVNLVGRGIDFNVRRRYARAAHGNPGRPQRPSVNHGHAGTAGAGGIVTIVGDVNLVSHRVHRQPVRQERNIARSGFREVAPLMTVTVPPFWQVGLAAAKVGGVNEVRTLVDGHAIGVIAGIDTACRVVRSVDDGDRPAATAGVGDVRDVDHVGPGVHRHVGGSIAHRNVLRVSASRRR